VELNPHILGLDAKFFAYRPAMAGWTLVNLSVLFAQIQLHGTVSLNMAVYQLLSFTYVFDYFWHEPLMITTWDIIAEHFGYMLVWGDYVFITFCFSIQSWYLVHYPAIGDSYSPWMIAYLIADIALFLVGYTIFRGTNAQKANFKFTDGKCLIWGKEPKVIVTERGTKLLCSGWWGLARHINYTGDIIIALSMALPCVAGGFFAYLYPGYLVLLLLDRAHRDDRRCREKYGKDWVTYCNEVPHTFIPGIY
jgi:protein-S-isoprenylcysteine O-methyltransferase Ste14